MRCQLLLVGALAVVVTGQQNQQNKNLLGIPFLSMLNDPNTLSNALKLLAPQQPQQQQQQRGIQGIPTRQQFNLAAFPKQPNEFVTKSTQPRRASLVEQPIDQLQLQPSNPRRPLQEQPLLRPLNQQPLQQQQSLQPIQPQQQIQQNVVKDYGKHPFGDLSQFTSLDRLLGVQNFGIEKGAGCFPLLGDVVKALFSNCQKQADVKAIATWGNQWTNVLSQKQLNLGAATQRTCELQAEKTHCQPLSQAVQVCDIVAGISTAQALQQEKERCKQLAELAIQPLLNSQFARQTGSALGLNGQQAVGGPQNPNQFITQIGQLLGGELAGAMFRNFINGRKKK